MKFIRISLSLWLLAASTKNIVVAFSTKSVGNGRDTSRTELNVMKTRTMSKAIPFLEAPKYLDGTLAGDMGFDPLKLGKNVEYVYQMREAEIKHGRLAMLAAAGWPLSELFDAKIASYFDVEPLVDGSDRVPSVLNGGMDKVLPEWWGFCLGLTAAIDLYGIQQSRKNLSSFPGDLNFDPLGLYPRDEEGKMNMQLAEIKHGRVAMMAVLGFAVQEAVLKVGVIDETPVFFSPMISTDLLSF